MIVCTRRLYRGDATRHQLQLALPVAAHVVRDGLHLSAVALTLSPVVVARTRRFYRGAAA